LTSARGISDYSEYIQIISRFPNRHAKIGSGMQEILKFFINKPYLSTYQIHKVLKKTGQATKHENIRRKVKRLYLLNLIENTSEVSKPRELMHSAVYYKLTTGGIFYLIYKAALMQTLPTGSKRRFIQYHGDNIIFKTFLYPYFEKETLLEIKGTTPFYEISRYLQKCCSATDNVLASLGKFSDIQLTMPLFPWNGEYDRSAIMILENEFQLNLGQKLRIEKIDKGRALRISDENDVVTLIKLDEEKVDRAFLILSDGRKYELGIERFNNELFVSIFIGGAEEVVFETFTNNIRNNLMSFVFSLVMGLTDGIQVLDVGDRNWKILINDARFVHLLEKTSESFHNDVIKIMNLK
jgi:hypothetical protein